MNVGRWISEALRAASDRPPASPECFAAMGEGFLEAWQKEHFTACTPLQDTTVTSSIDCYGCATMSCGLNHQTLSVFQHQVVLGAAPFPAPKALNPEVSLTPKFSPASSTFGCGTISCGLRSKTLKHAQNQALWVRHHVLRL